MTLPSGATATVSSTGTATYDPNGQFEYLAVGETATDTFTYSAIDSAGGLTNGLTFHSRMDEPAGATTTNDVSGNSRDGTLQGDTDGGVAGQIGGALTLDGSGDYISLPATTGDLGIQNGSFTAMAWVNPDATNGDRSIFGTDTTGTNNGLHLIIRNNKAHFGFYANDTAGNATIPTGQWTQIIWQYDATAQEQRIFVNGELDVVGTGKAAFTGDHIVNIGRWNNSGYFDGLMDDVAIWNQVLTQDQIDQLYCHGTTATEFHDFQTHTVTVTIDGVNDPVVITSTEDGSVLEDESATASETDTGVIAFTDVDLTDTHTASVEFDSTTHGGGQLGDMMVAVTTDSTNAANLIANPSFESNTAMLGGGWTGTPNELGANPEDASSASVDNWMRTGACMAIRQ